MDHDHVKDEFFVCLNDWAQLISSPGSHGHHKSSCNETNPFSATRTFRIQIQEGQLKKNK
jgi:hypothetical protein